MRSEQEYYRPKPDPRVYEEAIEKATFLIENGYIAITSGMTREILVDKLIEQSQTIEPISYGT
jgi:hypothetical protein